MQPNIFWKVSKVCFNLLKSDCLRVVSIFSHIIYPLLSVKAIISSNYHDFPANWHLKNNLEWDKEDNSLKMPFYLKMS